VHPPHRRLLRKSPPAAIDGAKVLRVTDYERDKVLDAEGDRVPPRSSSSPSRRRPPPRRRASGTEPKVKFYSFAKADVADADDLRRRRERARRSALALRGWLEADAKRRRGIDS
jgi:phosphoglucomutase